MECKCGKVGEKDSKNISKFGKMYQILEEKITYLTARISLLCQERNNVNYF